MLLVLLLVLLLALTRSRSPSLPTGVSAQRRSDHRQPVPRDRRRWRARNGGRRPPDAHRRHPLRPGLQRFRFLGGDGPPPGLRPADRLGIYHIPGADDAAARALLLLLQLLPLLPLLPLVLTHQHHQISLPLHHWSTGGEYREDDAYLQVDLQTDHTSMRAPPQVVPAAHLTACYASAARGQRHRAAAGIYF